MITFRLPNGAYIFSAELKAIHLALDHIESEGYWRYIIVTDSLSAMQAPYNDKIENPIIVYLLFKLSRICATAHVVFCWIPSHMGIHGNEHVDLAAKSAFSHDILHFKISYSDFKPLILYILKYLIPILNL